MPNLDIHTLYDMAKDGDREAEAMLLRTLRERFRPIVQRRLRGHADTEDVVQETLIAIAERYRDVAISHSFISWAHAVLKKKIANHCRTWERRSRWVVSYEILPEASVSAESTELDIEHVLNCLKAVAQENPRYARVLSLRYQGYTTEEICQIMKVSRNNLYVILSRARSLLRRCLDDEGGTDE